MRDICKHTGIYNEHILCATYFVSVLYIFGFNEAYLTFTCSRNQNNIVAMLEMVE